MECKLLSFPRCSNGRCVPRGDHLCCMPLRDHDVGDEGQIAGLDEYGLHESRRPVLISMYPRGGTARAAISLAM